MRKQSVGHLLPRILIALVAVLASWAPVRAQHQVAVKTNLLYDATATVNLGMELPLARKWSFDLSGNLNLWSINDHKWRHWLIQPEGRYWFCRRFIGHFVGFHALGGEYNAGNLDLGINFLGTDFRKLKDRRYEGWFVGAGVAYGYAWALNLHWNLEAEIGLGWIYTRFDSYPCAKCGNKLASGRHHNYFGPTKAAVNLVYLF